MAEFDYIRWVRQQTPPDSRVLIGVGDDCAALTWTAGLPEDLFLGMKERADQFGVAVVGGDTNTWDGPLAVTVTLFGEPTGAGPVRRSGAEPGDWLLVTGTLGGSILGRHLNFTPRVRE